MNKLLSESEAQEILQPHLPTLRQIMRESLEALNKAIGAAGESINNRAKCSLLHSLAIEKANRYFKDCSDIIMKSKYQSIQIIFGSRLIGRIKKVNKNDLSMNAKTNRNQAILTHQPTLFPDLTNPTFIDIGYKIDAAWAEFEKLLIVCRIYDQIVWKLPYKDILGRVAMMQPKEETLTTKEEKQIKLKSKNK